MGAETPPRQVITVLRIRGLRGTWIGLLFNMFTETFFPLKRENMHRLFSQVRRVDTSSSLHPCPLSGDNRLTSLLECLGDVSVKDSFWNRRTVKIAHQAQESFRRTWQAGTMCRRGAWQSDSARWQCSSNTLQHNDCFVCFGEQCLGSYCCYVGVETCVEEYCKIAWRSFLKNMPLWRNFRASQQTFPQKIPVLRLY